MIRGFEPVTRRFELVTHGFELVTHGFDLVTCGLVTLTRNSYDWKNNKKIYKKVRVARHVKLL